MAIELFNSSQCHSHLYLIYLHMYDVAFVSIPVFQTFDPMIWYNEFSWSKVVRGDSMGRSNGT